MNRGTIIGIILVSVLGACNTLKFVPEGEQLITDIDVKLHSDDRIKEKSSLESELKDIMRPEVNSKFFWARFGLWTHYKGNKEGAGKIATKLKDRFGEEPAYLSLFDRSRTESLISNRLENRGFFYSDSEIEIIRKKKKARIKIKVETSRPYLLATYELLSDTTIISQDIQNTLESTKLKPGVRYDLDQLKQERERIETQLKEIGYFYFNADYLIFTLDTNQYETRKFDLYLSVKPGLDPKWMRPYTINEISVFPDYAVTNGSSAASDTVTLEGVHFIQDREVFKPRHLRDFILFSPGDLYSLHQQRLTSARLSGIGNFRFVNVRYNPPENQEEDEAELDAQIFLSPMTKRALRFEVQGLTKSNNFVGPALLGTYKNRNLFRGGELLNITGIFGFETQFSGGRQTGLSSYELGIQSEYIMPRIISPIPIKSRLGYSIPRTKAQLGASYLDRVQFYKLNSFMGAFGYEWSRTKYISHEIFPVSVNLTNLSSTTPEFEEILGNNPFLRRSFEQQFILGLTYNFQFNQLFEKKRKHGFYTQANLDMSGNTMHLFQNVIGGSDRGELLGASYNRYVRVNADLRYYLRVGKRSKLVYRAFAGVGIPLGDSFSLPYIKQFFSGGPNSVRGFRIRSLGPGTYRPDNIDVASFFDQTGDIKLETNLEFRFPMFPFLNGAFFVDAGNIWLMNDNEALPGGQFTSDWHRQLAVAAGYGLRVDIEFFVIRLDLGIPLHTPGISDGSRWLRTFELGNKQWRRENLIFNFAIGYPF